MNPVVLIKHYSARACALGGLALFLTGARADVVFAWNELLLQLVTCSSPEIPPQLEVRAFAIAHLAIDEAVRSVSSGAPEPSGLLAAQRAAAVAAAQTAWTELLPAHASAFAALAERHLAALPAGADKARGIETGRNVARQGLRRRQQDGWVDLAHFHPIAGPVPQNSEMAAQALARGESLPPSPWLSATPFVIKTAEQFAVSEVRNVTRFGTVEIDRYLQHSRLLHRVDQPAAIATREGYWAQNPWRPGTASPDS